MNDNLKATIIENIIPQFIRDEYPNFVEFIKVYYAHQDLEGEAYQFIANILDFMDVDRTTLEYLDNFSGMYLASFSDTLLSGINKRTLIKNIKQFYESAGSEKSFKFLFKILFDEDVELYYPTDDVLRVSDGKWVNQSVIKISNNRDGEMIGLVGTEIVGQTSGARGLVETVELYEASNGFLVAECGLSSLSPVNDYNEFLVGETVVGVTLDGQTTMVETVFSIITDVDVTINDLYNYSGDIAEISEGPGVDGYVVVNSVESGGIEAIEVIEPGSGYSVNDIIEFTSTSGRAAKGYVASIDGSGGITSAGIVSTGHSYVNMPSYSIVSAGTGARLYPVSSTIGKIKTVDINNSGVNYLESTTPGFPYNFPLAFTFQENAITFYQSAFIYDYSWNDINYKINETIIGQTSGAVGEIKRINQDTGILGYTFKDVAYDATVEWGNLIFASVSRVQELNYDWTIWLKTPPDFSATSTFIGSSETGGFAIRTNVNARFQLYSIGLGSNIVSTFDLSPDTVYKIRAIGDNSNVDIYIDDIFDDTAAITFPYTIDVDTVFGKQRTYEYYKGEIYRVQFRDTEETVLNDWNFVSYENSPQQIAYDIVGDDHAALNGNASSYFTLPYSGTQSTLESSGYTNDKFGFFDSEEIIGEVSGAEGYFIYKQFDTSGSIVPGSISDYSGYYRNTDGFVSGDKYIQDSYYYQDFSYAITTLEDQENWIGPVKDMLHPAGTIVFGFSARESEIYGYSDGGWISPRLNTLEFYKFNWGYHTDEDGVSTGYSDTQLSEFQDTPIYAAAEIREGEYEEDYPNGIIEGESINTLRKTNVCFGSKIQYVFADNDQSVLIDSINYLLIDSSHTLLI